MRLERHQRKRSQFRKILRKIRVLDDWEHLNRWSCSSALATPASLTEIRWGVYQSGNFLNNGLFTQELWCVRDGEPAPCGSVTIQSKLWGTALLIGRIVIGPEMNVMLRVGKRLSIRWRKRRIAEIPFGYSWGWENPASVVVPRVGECRITFPSVISGLPSKDLTIGIESPAGLIRMLLRPKGGWSLRLPEETSIRGLVRIHAR